MYHHEVSLVFLTVYDKNASRDKLPKMMCVITGKVSAMFRFVISTNKAQQKSRIFYYPGLYLLFSIKIFISN